MSEKKSWRDVYKVHPAADLFPMLPEDELRKLGEDIKANGLKEPIAFWSLHTGMDAETMVLDGRNRLDAMELVGIETVAPVGKKYWIAIPARFLCLGKNPEFPDCGQINPYSYAISKNVHRRHLTKEERADMILQAVKLNEKLGEEISALALGKASSDEKNFYSNKRSFSPEPGQRGGSTKNPLKEKFLDETKKQGISKATAQKSWDKDRGPVQHPRETKTQVSESSTATFDGTAINRISDGGIEYLKRRFINLKRSEVAAILCLIVEHFQFSHGRGFNLLEAIEQKAVIELEAKVRSLEAQLLAYESMNALREAMGEATKGTAALEDIDWAKWHRRFVKKYHPDGNGNKMFSGNEIMTDFLQKPRKQ